MAGEAKTNQFLLATATVMVGPMADVFALTPEDHSIGLVKNVQAQAQQRFADLMQGVTNQLVYSVNVENNTTVSCEVYEYTARNLAYASGIEASGAGYDPKGAAFALDADLEDDDTTIVIDGTGDLTEIVAGDWLLISDLAGSDNVYALKAGTVTAATRTIAIPTGYEPPAGVTFSAATSVVYLVHGIKQGTQSANGLVGVKVVGVLPEANEPVTLIYPKVRITSGLNMSFQTENFSNMPFEFRPFALVPGDAFYDDFKPNKSGILLRR